MTKKNTSSRNNVENFEVLREKLLGLNYKKLQEILFKKDNFSDSKEVFFSLEDGEEQNFVDFLLKQFKFLQADLSSSFKTILFQFYGFVTYFFDPKKNLVKSSVVTDLPEILHEQEKLNEIVIDVCIRSILNLEIEECPRKIKGLDVANICNALTIIQNYVGFEFQHEKRLFCKKLIEHPKLFEFINATLYLLDLRIDPSSLNSNNGSSSIENVGSKSIQLKSFFQSHLTEFWNSVINWTVFPENIYFQLVKTIVDHPKFKLILSHILGNIRVNNDFDSLYFLQMLAEGPLLTTILTDHMKSLLDEYLSMTLSMIMDLVDIGLNETQIYSVHVLDIFVDFCSEPKIVDYLLKNQVYRVKLLNFIETISKNHLDFFSIEDVFVKHKELVMRVGKIIIQLYCCLMRNSDETRLVDILCNNQTNLRQISSILDHLKALKMMQINNIDDWDLKTFTRFLKELETKLNFNRRLFWNHSVKKKLKRNKKLDGSDKLKENKYIYREKPGMSKEDISICRCFKEFGTAASCNSDICTNRKSRVECITGFCKAPFCENRRLQESGVFCYKKENEDKGCFLVAGRSFQSGDFIIEYVGEVMTVTEFLANMMRVGLNKRNCFAIRLDAIDVLDASLLGNVSRYITHSCNPNCEFQRWFVAGVVRVGLYAKKNISSNCELTVDFKNNFFGAEDFLCHCGAENCAVLIRVSNDTRSSVRSEKKRKRPVDEFFEKLKSLPLSLGGSLNLNQNFKGTLQSISYEGEVLEGLPCNISQSSISKKKSRTGELKNPLYHSKLHRRQFK